MADDYTPTTDEIANHYCDWNRTAFDRWLAEHDRKLRNETLEEAAQTVVAGAMRANNATIGAEPTVWAVTQTKIAGMETAAAAIRAMKAATPTEPHDAREDER